MSLAKYANYFQMPALQRLVSEHILAHVSMSNCLDLLLFFGDTMEYLTLKKRCIEEAALHFPIVSRSESFQQLEFADVKEILTHPVLTIVEDGMSSILFKVGFHSNYIDSCSGIIPNKEM